MLCTPWLAAAALGSLPWVLAFLIQSSVWSYSGYYKEFSVQLFYLRAWR
ncbi:hypothetical protein [Piscirickettsia salmonis]